MVRALVAGAPRRVERKAEEDESPHPWQRLPRLLERQPALLLVHRAAQELNPAPIVVQPDLIVVDLQRPPQLGHQHRHAARGDVGALPQGVRDLAPGDRPRTRADQEGQEVEGPGGEVDALARPPELAATAVMWLLIVAAAVLLVGVAMIILPGPAILVIPAGLAILATEFAWARDLLRRMKEKARDLSGVSSIPPKGPNSGP